MAGYCDRSETEHLEGDTDHRPDDHADPDEPLGDGTRDRFGRDPADSLECGGEPHEPWTHRFDGFGDEEKGATVFDGGGESLQWEDEDPDWVGAGTGSFGDRGGTERNPLESGKVELPLLDDEGSDLHWGRRRADECPLNYLGGDNSTSYLGDGEDLP